MNPLLQLKKATPVFLVGLVLACFALSPAAWAGRTSQTSNVNIANTPTETVGNFLATQPPLPGCVPQPSGMVLWLTGNGVAVDKSPCHNAAMWQPNASVADYTSCMVGPVSNKQAFYFTGSTSSGFNSLKVKNKACLNFGTTGDMSIDAWVKLNTDPNRGLTIVYKIDNTGGTGYAMFIMDRVISFQFGTVITAGSNQLGFVAGQCHHVAATLDRSSPTPALKFYFDGTQVSNFTSIGLGIPLSNNLDLIVGGPWISPVADCAIDELDIFNRALTQAEILAIFNAGSAGKCP